MAPSPSDAPLEHTTPSFRPSDPPHAQPGQAAGGLADQAKAAAADIKQHARDLAGEAKAQVRSVGSEQKAAAAEQVHGFARALRTAADDLDQRDQRVSAGYVQQAADGLERVSGALRERDLDEIVASVEDFARRQPVAFIGGSVLAGFVLARFMKSSAERRRPRPRNDARRAYHGTPGETA